MTEDASHDPVASAKLARFQAALESLLERLRQDKDILAVVNVGSLTEELIWRRESLHLWIIEVDGVTRRRPADGNDERLFRTLVEDDIDIHAELIPRGRFRRMVEGASRTAFSCNYFAVRTLVYSADDSITGWFEQASRHAATDQERELLAGTAWITHAHRHATKLLERGDLDLAAQEILSCAHGLAALEVIRTGRVCEVEPIHRALELDRELFTPIYLDVLARERTPELLAQALAVIDAYLEDHAGAYLAPALDYLRRQQRVVPLSELADHFAFSQLYPWHLESACEWLARKGRLERVSATFRLTSRSRVDVEEPAYFLG